jgi:DNA polymerase III gamma/tau subunit
MFTKVIALLSLAQLASAQFLSPAQFEFPAFPSSNRLWNRQQMNHFGMNPLSPLQAMQQAMQPVSMLAEQMLGVERMRGGRRHRTLGGGLGGGFDRLNNIGRNMIGGRRREAPFQSPWGTHKRPTQKEEALETPATAMPNEQREKKADAGSQRTSPALQQEAFTRPPAQQKQQQHQQKLQQQHQQQKLQQQQQQKMQQQEQMQQQQQQQQQQQAATEQPTEALKQDAPSQAQEATQQEQTKSKEQRRAEKKEFYRRQKLETDTVERERAERAQKELLQRSLMEKELEDFIQVVDVAEQSGEGSKLPKHQLHVAELGEEFMEL